MAELPELADASPPYRAVKPGVAKAGAGAMANPAEEKLSLRRGETESAPAGAHSEEKPEQLPVHKALSSFNVMIGPQMRSFEMGETIVEQGTIRTLLDLGCPIGQARDMLRHRCGSCGSMAAISPTKSELRSVAEAMGLELIG